eukprot:1384982-Pyramimonas_sp.AAC.1
MPALHASDWSIVRTCPRSLRLIGPGGRRRGGCRAGPDEAALQGRPHLGRAHRLRPGGLAASVTGRHRRVLPRALRRAAPSEPG